MRLIGRIIWVGIATILSTVAAALVTAAIALQLLMQTNWTANPQDTTIPERLRPLLDGPFNVPASTLSSLLLTPLFIVLAGEVIRIRSFLFYLLGGGLSFAAIPLVAQIQDAPLPAAVNEAFVVTGFVAGTFYWMLAGRRA